MKDLTPEQKTIEEALLAYILQTLQDNPFALF
ncbi:hypothetical protein SAMN04488505_102721 [Chitinophaga rupis]|uniref:Uncharacterized protein n=1 Tax=Chitinophaga rupis TaxID=573321 RepID=A0A1H7RSM6_9BACT|nr:hypothetical protein SAMN04488505_102721 [Chitinophaga rupis]